MVIPEEFKDQLEIFHDLVLMHPIRDHLIRPRLPIPAHSNGVYVIVNPFTGVFYFGSSNHVLRRLSEHRSDMIEGCNPSKKLQEAFEKSFYMKVSTLLVETRKEAFDIEQKLIDSNQGNELMANVATCAYSSGLGKIPSLETRMKISIANKGRPFTEKMREAVKLANTGRKATPKMIDRVISLNKTRIYPQEERDSIRERMLGNKLGIGHRVSDSTLDHIRNFNLGKKLSEETKLKIMESRNATRTMADYEDPRNIAVVIKGTIYRSISHASKVLNMLHGTVWGRVNSSNPVFNEWRYYKD
jgi:group I intron endonuclease